MAEITPSVGRKVWYYDSDGQSEPWDATVVKVHGGEWTHSPFSLVNLVAIDPDSGQSYFIERVQCSPTPNGGRRYCWMPYQYQQAAKAAQGNSTRVNFDEQRCISALMRGSDVPP